MHKKFSQIVTLEPTGVIINSPDQLFLKRIMTCIEDHMDDPEFSVPVLSSERGMSQPVLYKKIRALTDLSVNEITLNTSTNYNGILKISIQENVNGTWSSGNI